MQEACANTATVLPAAPSLHLTVNTVIDRFMREVYAEIATTNTLDLKHNRKNLKID